MKSDRNLLIYKYIYPLNSKIRLPGLECMKKIKYYYNTNTLRYEKLVTPLQGETVAYIWFYFCLAGKFCIGNLVVHQIYSQAHDRELTVKV